MEGARNRLTTLFLPAALLAFAGTVPAYADMAFLLEEPFGMFGAMNPTGHAALYFSRVCADSPHHLRRCAAGETGVVISRYHEVAGYDWLAVPLIPYLYAVDNLDEVPLYASEEAVAHLRDSYRRRALRDLIPDGPDGAMPPGEWIQLVGSSYDRRIYSFKVETTEEQDDQLIERLNAAPNRARFNLFFNNCADFSRRIINAYYPGSVRRNILADAGLTTPKQVAKSLVKYARKHPELRMTAFVVPQIGGTPESRKVRGVLESLLMSKKYAIPLVVLQPLIAPTLAASYVTAGRFDPHKAVGGKDAIEWAPGRVLAQFHPQLGQSTVAGGLKSNRPDPLPLAGGYAP